jgi:hypothetical protein
MAKKRKKESDIIEPEFIEYEQPNAQSSFLKDIFDILFGFNFDMAIKPLKMILFLLVRGLIIFYTCSDIYNSPLNDFANYLEKFWFGGLFIVPFCLYGLFYIFSWITTLIIFFIGYKEIPSNKGKYSEINKFKDWRDNKANYTDYEGAADLMRKSSVLNNLDEKNPQAEKTLDYINNKLKFMSYQDGLKWLSGDKKE